MRSHAPWFASSRKIGWLSLPVCLLVSAIAIAQTQPAPQAPASGQHERDPFEPLVRPTPPQVTPRPELTRQPLAGLRLVGVIWNSRGREDVRALVQTPEGQGYWVGPNEEKFGGKVVAIERERVEFLIREPIPGGLIRERRVELKLAE